jgi:hypothetical protein
MLRLRNSMLANPRSRDAPLRHGEQFPTKEFARPILPISAAAESVVFVADDDQLNARSDGA